MDAIASLPQRVGPLNQVGVDDAVDMVVTGGLLATLDQALQTDPRLTIRRLFILDPHQRSRLYSMTNPELDNFIRPVFELIHSDHPERKG